MSYDTKVRTTTVAVWHRTDAIGGLAGWSIAEAPRLAFAYEYEVESATMREDHPHEGCFRINNRVTGESFELPVVHETRRLSVGDVVRVAYSEDRFMNWAVEPVGWATITEEDFQEATA